VPRQATFRALLVSTFVSSSTLGQASFRAIGEAPEQSCAQAVSADGRAVVGAMDVPGGHEAFQWTEADGLLLLGDLPGGSQSNSAESVSGDGTVVVGYANGQHFINGTRAFQWNAVSGMTMIDAVSASDVSDNGQIIVGVGISWPHATADIQLYGCFGCDPTTNADGSVLAATTRRWVHHPNGDLTVNTISPPGQVAAIDVSPDGNWVVGRPAFRWSASTGLQSLGAGEARGVSAGGSVIVGGGPEGAFIWDAANGRRVLKDVLQRDYCLNLTGWNLTSAFGVSDDGLTIVGCGTDPDNLGRAWVARLAAAPIVCPPIPAISEWGGAVLALGALSAGTLLLRRNRVAQARKGE